MALQNLDLALPAGLRCEVHFDGGAGAGRDTAMWRGGPRQAWRKKLKVDAGGFAQPRDPNDKPSIPWTSVLETGGQAASCLRKSALIERFASRGGFRQSQADGATVRR